MTHKSTPRTSSMLRITFRNFLFLTFLGVAVTALLGGCASDKKFYDSGYNHQTVTVDRGDMVPLRLIVNIQTGAKWEIVELDRSMLDMRGEPHMQGTIVTGGLPRIYSYEYMMRAVREGTTTVKMRMVKPDTGEVLDTFEMTVVVK